MSLGISDGHAYAGVRHAAATINLRVVLFAHSKPDVVAHVLDVPSLVGGSREAVVHPKERAHLHVVG